MVSCEDKQNEAPPREFDRQIDSIASESLPAINPDMIDQSSGDRDESRTRFREPGALDSETGRESDRMPNTVAGPDEPVDTQSPVANPTDPNSA